MTCKLVKNFIFWNKEEIPNSLVEVAKSLNYQKDLKERLFNRTLSYQSIYAYVYKKSVDTAQERCNASQYWIGVFTKRRICEKDKCTLKICFEPQLLFLYAYYNDNLEDKSYALITYVGWNSEKTLNQLIRLVKKRNLSFIEVEKDAVKILYGEAKKKGFLEFSY
jgi:hypothetical protein